MVVEMNTSMFMGTLLIVVLYFLTKHIVHKLHRLPPTPFPALPLIGHLHLLSKPLHLSLAKLSHRHGPVLFLRFGSRPALHVASPLAAEECLSKNDIVFANRPRLLSGKYFGYNYTSLPWAPYGKHWQNLRRISALEILSSTRLDALSHIRFQEIRSLTRRLFLAADKNPDHTIELRSELFGFMFNVMTRMMGGKRYYGTDIGNLEEGKKFQDIVTASNQLNAQSSMADMLPIMRWFVTGKLEKRYAVMQKRRDDFMREWIDEFRADRDRDRDGEGMKAFFQVMLSLQDADPEYYTDKEIKSLSQALLHGGISTSVETMEWAMSLLLNNPHALNKAQIEIDGVVGTNHLVNELDLSQLPYLQCIIKETLRKHPTVPVIVPHESSKECVVGGYHVPQGTMLLVNAWAIQNDPKIWDHPELFKPERFEGKENINNVEGLIMMPFGHGRRRCPGENLALRIVGLALASLIQCFDWSRVSEELEDMSASGGFTAPKARPLLAKYQTRPIFVNHLSLI